MYIYQYFATYNNEEEQRTVENNVTGDAIDENADTSEETNYNEEIIDNNKDKRRYFL